MKLGSNDMLRINELILYYSSAFQLSFQLIDFQLAAYQNALHTTAASVPA